MCGRERRCRSAWANYSRAGSGGDGGERNVFTRRSRETETERSAECGRARDAGSRTKEAAQTQTRKDLAVCVCVAPFVRVTAGFASRRPHGSHRSGRLRFFVSLCDAVPSVAPVSSGIRLQRMQPAARLRALAMRAASFAFLLLRARILGNATRSCGL